MTQLFSLAAQKAGFEAHVNAEADGLGITVSTDQGPIHAHGIDAAIRAAADYIGQFLETASGHSQAAVARRAFRKPCSSGSADAGMTTALCRLSRTLSRSSTPTTAAQPAVDKWPKAAGNGARWPSESGCGHLPHGAEPSVATSLPRSTLTKHARRVTQRACVISWGDPMHLVGRLSNPSPAQGRAFLAFPEGVPERAPSTSAGVAAKRVGNAFVLRAVLAALRDGEPRSVREVGAVVEKRLDRSVSIHSVNWCLSMGSRKEPLRFERVARGVYRLRPPT
jgi:hypothetical protein